MQEISPSQKTTSAYWEPAYIVMGALALIFVAFIPFSQWAFDVQYDYTLRNVALGGALLGLVSGALGAFAVLRRQSLTGDVLSHAALPGVALGFLVAGRELAALLVGAGVTAWLSVMFVNTVVRTTRLKQDAAMGMVLAAFFAFGMALLGYIQSRADASQAGLKTFIFGQAAAIRSGDVQLMAGVVLAVFLILAVFWKEFQLITFDPEFSLANGYPLRLLDTLLSTLIVVAIVLGLQMAGVILMVGILIAPAVAARQWTSRLWPMVALAGVTGAFSGAGGAILSATGQDLPTGPLIIVVAMGLVFISLAFAPGRGLIWDVWKRRQDRQRFAQ